MAQEIKDLSTLRIHKLTQEQYLRESDAGRLEETAIYITPDVVPPVAIVTGGTGAAYTATVPTIKSLEAGVSFVMIPHTTSTTTTPTLNVNGSGAKGLRRRTSTSTSYLSTGCTTSWIVANKPIRVMYDGASWVIEGISKTTISDLDGTIPINKGGTGATTAAKALENLGLTEATTSKSGLMSKTDKANLDSVVSQLNGYSIVVKRDPNYVPDSTVGDNVITIVLPAK